MKIGIMTFWWSNDNYGQQLQCFALQKYLRDAGHDAYLIRYDPRNDYIKKPPWKKALKVLNPLWLHRYLLNKRKKLMLEKTYNLRGFEKFRSKYINQSEKVYYSYYELKENPPEADVYIVGSDQIWNPNSYPSIERQSGAYFLDFGNSLVKRISYAASFGKNELENDFVRFISPLLQKFYYVSVREKSGLSLCKQCKIENAEWVPDPTMLLDVDVYRSLYEKEPFKKPSKPYCFFYFLSNECDFSVKTLYAWAKKKNIDIIYVSAGLRIDKYKKNYATISEWIYLLENAEYVITNSYHCSVFSLLYRKKFGVVPLSGKNVWASMNTRIDSLFELFQIKERYIHSDFSVLETEVDWQSVSNIFQNLRNSCRLIDAIK